MNLERFWNYQPNHSAVAGDFAGAVEAAAVIVVVVDAGVVVVVDAGVVIVAVAVGDAVGGAFAAIVVVAFGYCNQSWLD